MLLNEQQLQKGEFSHAHDVERLEKQYGEDHLYTIEGMKTLAYRYMHRENFKDAETVFLRVLDLAKKNFGPEDLYTVDLLFDVGLAFAGQAHFQETRRFLELFVHLGRQLLRRSSKTWTIAGNPSSVIEQQTLAALSKNLEAYVDKAESLIASMPTLPLDIEDEEGFKDLELSFGKLETAVEGIKRQSLEYVNEGRWKKAEEYIVFMLGMHERILGSEHSETLAILDLLASLYEAHGQWGDAEWQRAKLAKLVRRKRGDRDPETFFVETILAKTAAKQGNERAEEAQEMLRGILGRATPVLRTVFKWMSMQEIKATIEALAVNQTPSPVHEFHSELLGALGSWATSLQASVLAGERHTGSSREPKKAGEAAARLESQPADRPHIDRQTARPWKLSLPNFLGRRSA